MFCVYLFLFETLSMFLLLDILEQFVLLLVSMDSCVARVSAISHVNVSLQEVITDQQNGVRYCAVQRGKLSALHETKTRSCDSGWDDHRAEHCQTCGTCGT